MENTRLVLKFIVAFTFFMSALIGLACVIVRFVYHPSYVDVFDYAIIPFQLITICYFANFYIKNIDK